MKDEKALKAKINAKGMQISVVSDGSYDDYISVTDIAKYKSEDPALMHLPYPQNAVWKLRLQLECQQ